MTSPYLSNWDDAPSLIKIDDWEIQAINRDIYAHIKIDSFIVHHCSQVHSTGNWKDRDMVILQECNLKNRCLYCGRSAPDEIQALWRLQNMEKL